MFSSALSIRQNIKAVDTDLYDYKISNNGRVDVLETFKAGLEGTGEGSIADLEAKHDQQAALITTVTADMVNDTTIHTTTKSYIISYLISYMILLGFHWKLWVVWVMVF
jgi:radical SAM superfamily enzyme YgiQ (UPF0313 family)